MTHLAHQWSQKWMLSCSLLVFSWLWGLSHQELSLLTISGQLLWKVLGGLSRISGQLCLLMCVHRLITNVWYFGIGLCVRLCKLTWASGCSPHCCRRWYWWPSHYAGWTWGTRWSPAESLRCHSSAGKWRVPTRTRERTGVKRGQFSNPYTWCLLAHW